MYSNLAYVFIFLYIASIEGLCGKLKYRATIIHHFICVFCIYFFYHSSCRKDQFTGLSLNLVLKILLIPVY